MALRNSKSCCTVIFSYPVRKMLLCAFSNSARNRARSLSLSSLFFMRFLSPRKRSGALHLPEIVGGNVQRDARPHGGADRRALDVLAFGHCRFRLHHRLDKHVGVFEKLLRVET